MLEAAGDLNRLDRPLEPQQELPRWQPHGMTKPKPLPEETAEEAMLFINC